MEKKKGVSEGEGEQSREGLDVEGLWLLPLDSSVAQPEPHAGFASSHNSVKAFLLSFPSRQAGQAGSTWLPGSNRGPRPPRNIISCSAADGSRTGSELVGKHLAHLRRQKLR